MKKLFCVLMIAFFFAPALASAASVDCGTGSTLTFYRWGPAGADTVAFGSIENGFPETWVQVNSGTQFNIPCSGVWEIAVQGYAAYFVAPPSGGGGGSLGDLAETFSINNVWFFLGVLCGSLFVAGIKSRI